MKRHDRRLKNLEDKAGTGPEPIRVIIHESYVPSPDGPKLVGFSGSLVGGGGTRLKSLPGESLDDFEKRLYEAEADT